MVNLAIRVLSRPDVKELPTIYRTLGKDYDERVLPSICHEVMKSVVVRFQFCDHLFMIGFISFRLVIRFLLVV
jgi:hypothetical protein